MNCQLDRNQRAPTRPNPRTRIFCAIILCAFALAWYARGARASFAATCPEFSPAVARGAVESAALTEISGIAASRVNSNVLWAHNDSGDSARVFAMSATGRHLGIYAFADASAVDWEDLAIGPGAISGQDYIYVGDTGDNARARSFVVVYRAPEPTVDINQTPANTTVSGWEAFPLQYPASQYDAETLLVDPSSGDIFLVTRDRAHEGFARVFRKPAPHTHQITTTLELVATIALPYEVKGGDIASAGDAVILRLHSGSTPMHGYLWTRAPGTNLWDAFNIAPCLVPLPTEPQGEALGFAPGGLGFWTISEGSFQPIYYSSRHSSLALPLVAR